MVWGLGQNGIDHGGDEGASGMKGRQAARQIQRIMRALEARLKRRQPARMMSW
jgi:hypothetical protein